MSHFDQGLYGSHTQDGKSPIKTGMPYSEIEIGLSVKQTREQLGLSRPQLAERLDVEPDTIKKIEEGTRVKQWEWLAKVAEALETTPNALLGVPTGFGDQATEEALESALKPILAAFGHNPDDADSIARILLEAVQAAQSLPAEGPVPLRYGLAGKLAAARSPAKPSRRRRAGR